jgi:hypothetical protein
MTRSEIIHSKGNSMTRQEIIDVFLIRAASSERDELRRILEKMTWAELEQAYDVIQVRTRLEATNEKLAQIAVDSAAERIWHEEGIRLAREPQRKAEATRQLAKDHKTFMQAAKTLRSFALNEANFNVIRSILGPNFTEYSIQQGLANVLQLSPPTQKELTEWERERIEQENLRLQAMSIPELRKLAREAGARGPAAPELDQVQKVRTASQPQFEPLPSTILYKGGEELLDRDFLLRGCDKDFYKYLLNRYGSVQLTARINDQNYFTRNKER